MSEVKHISDDGSMILPLKVEQVKGDIFAYITDAHNDVIADNMNPEWARAIVQALNSQARLVEEKRELAETVFFFASCIKAGDHWSDTCEKALVRARALIKELSHDE